MLLLPTFGGCKLLFEQFISGVSSGIISPIKRMFEVPVSRFEEGNGHKTDDLPFLLNAYFVLHKYFVPKEIVNEQKHKCSTVR